jgi:hypothetical protein
MFFPQVLPDQKEPDLLPTTYLHIIKELAEFIIKLSQEDHLKSIDMFWWFTHFDIVQKDPVLMRYISHKVSKNLFTTITKMNPLIATAVEPILKNGEDLKNTFFLITGSTFFLSEAEVKKLMGYLANTELDQTTINQLTDTAQTNKDEFFKLLDSRRISLKEISYSQIFADIDSSIYGSLEASTRIPWPLLINYLLTNRFSNIKDAHSISFSFYVFFFQIVVRDLLDKILDYKKKKDVLLITKILDDLKEKVTMEGIENFLS